MAENDARKRDALTFSITAQVRKSAASCRFVDEFRASGEHAEKRAKVIAALRSGQMLEEAGLEPVLAFLDTEGFENLNVRERQLLVLARLQDFMGVNPHTAPVAVPVEVVAQPPSAQEQQAEEPETQQQATSEKPDEKPPAEPPVADKKPNPMLANFASKLSG
jgi:hypothetical protein